MNIPIIDDAINEHQETLVGFIEITQATDTDTIMLGRSAAQLIIDDNDGNKTFLKNISRFRYSVCFCRNNDWVYGRVIHLHGRPGKCCCHTCKRLWSDIGEKRYRS